jgi:hypothetical protein
MEKSCQLHFAACFTTEEIVSGTKWMGDWKEFGVGQDVLEKRK